MSVLARVIEHARSTPDKAALIAGERTLGYAALARQVEAAAGALCRRGVRAGDRVVLAAAPSIEFAGAYLAAHGCGAVAVPVDPHVPPERIRALAALVDASAVYLERPQDVPGALPLATLDGGGRTSGASLDAMAPGEAADVLFTSGTSAAPKGVVQTHGGQVASAESMVAFIGNTAEDREVLAAPLHHAFGLGRLRASLWAGGTCILVPGFRSPRRLFDALGRHAASGFSLVPAAWRYLWKLTGSRLGRHADTLRYVEIGSAPLPPSDRRALMDLLPATRLYAQFGLTEAPRSLYIELHRHPDRPDSIGAPAPRVEARVEVAAGLEASPGEAGELLLRGPHLARGYWGAAERVPGSWLRTGDVVSCRDGHFYYHGRRDELINTAGYRVSPLEVESIVRELDFVDDCACVGIEDPALGQAIKAFVVARGAEPAARAERERAIRARLGERVEPFKIPQHFAWVEALPRTPNGKLMRRLLAP